MTPAGIFHALATVEGLKMGRCTAREPAPIQPVDTSVVDATLPHLPAVVADMVRFQRLTGCRPGEVCQLRPGDLDRSGEVWQYRPASHKTQHHGRRRVIFIGPQAQAVLLLVALCRELQEAAKDEPFSLSCHKAAKLLELVNAKGEHDHLKAWRWLGLLVNDGVLEVVEKGSCAVLHFGRVSFMSSAALGMLVRVTKKCKEYKITLKLCNIAPDIRQVFKITGLEKVFDIQDDIAQAVAAFKNSGLLSFRGNKPKSYEVQDGG